MGPACLSPGGSRWGRLSRPRPIWVGVGPWAAFWPGQGLPVEGIEQVVLREVVLREARESDAWSEGGESWHEPYPRRRTTAGRCWHEPGPRCRTTAASDQDRRST